MKQINQPKLLSFHNDPAIKEKYLNRLRLHYKADEIIKGTYWENGKGCAVGCTVHSSNHASYESELGIPQILARLEDRIFEGLPNEKAKEFPIQFLEAIPVGVDLDPVWRKFMIWLLIDETEGVIRQAKIDKTKKAIKDVAKAFSDSLTKTVSHEKWVAVRRVVYAAAYATDAVDATTTHAAAAAYAADAAYTAAVTAAHAATDAYAAAVYAANAAYAAAASAAHAANADDAHDARNSKYVAMSEKLIELFKDV